MIIDLPIWLGIALIILTCCLGCLLLWHFPRKLRYWRAEYTTVREQAVLASRELAISQDHERELIQERDDLLAHNIKLQRDLAVLSSEKSSIERLYKNYHTKLKETKDEMTLHFENLANKIFEHNSGTFSDHYEKKLSLLLNPLQERLSLFQRKVEDVFGQESRERFALQKEIDRIVQVHQEMVIKADSLAKALRGDNKKLGNWGEFILEKILEDSGLRPEKDYVVQSKHLDSADGRNLYPDVVINLPDNKHIVVDSKVSLKHYDALINSQDENEKTELVKKFISSVRSHVKDLAGKDYYALANVTSPDFVLMFIPIEASYAFAMQQDQTLHSFAWRERVIIVCPTTLLATLKTVATIWRVDMQNKNAIEIANQAGMLFDKFNGFLKDMNVLRSALVKSQEAFNGALKKLCYGKGNLLSKADNLKKLGARTANSVLEIQEVSSNFIDIKDDV